MAKISFALVVLSVFLACEKIETRTEKFPNGNLKARYEVTVKKDVVTKNGVYEEFWENKRPKSIVNFVDNKQHGVYRSYYQNGKMESEIYYIHGDLHGESLEWYDNGKKKRSAKYKNGKLNGTLKTWDSSGSVVAEAKFSQGNCELGDCGKLGYKVRVNVD